MRKYDVNKHDTLGVCVRMYASPAEYRIDLNAWLYLLLLYIQDCTYCTCTAQHSTALTWPSIIVMLICHPIYRGTRHRQCQPITTRHIQLNQITALNRIFVLFNVNFGNLNRKIEIYNSTKSHLMIILICLFCLGKFRRLLWCIVVLWRYYLIVNQP